MGERLTLRPYQAQAIAEAKAAYRDGKRAILIVCPTGGGKCLGRGTLVLRYDGRVVPVEDICPGDLLMGPDSQPRVVLSTASGRSDLYRIVPVKGDPWVCNDVHVLTLVRTQTDAVVDIALPEYLTSSRTFKHEHKQFAPPNGIDFAPGEGLPVDPYFLGLWYGDGDKSDGTSALLRGVTIAKPDPEVRACCDQIATTWGYRVVTFDEDRCPQHRIASAERDGGGRTVNRLLDAIRGVYGDGSALPHAYLTASRADREAFLAGLLDSDGYMHNGGFEIAQKRRGWADGICFLARSLGFRALMGPKVVGGETYWRIFISGDLWTLPIRIPRKRPAARRQKKIATRTGFAVEAIGNGEYFGFELDGDGRFLLGDFTVTHNTLLGSRIVEGAVSKGGSVLWLAHREELLGQARERLLANGIDRVGLIASGQRSINARVQVASVQTLAARMAKGLPPASVVVFDECVTGDTMVGNMRASDVRVGDKVPAWDGQRVVWRSVTHVSARSVNRLVSVTVGGLTLHCSDNHPIWVEGRDYVRADDVRAGDVCRVWEPDGLVSRSAAEDVQRSMRESKALADDVKHEHGSRVGAHEESQPNAQCANTGEDGGNASGLGPSSSAGWQWSTDASAAGDATRSPRIGLASGVAGGNGAPCAGHAHPLHDRSGARDNQDGRRGGRTGACGDEGEGQAQGRVSYLARVDRVEVHERASDDGFDRLCPGGLVYNFEVDGEHNFFANGILTHNCHHFVASEWGRVARAIKDHRGNPPAILGLTATPERGDGKPLGDLFDHIIPVSSVRELQETPDPITGRPVLVPCVVWRPSSPTKKLSQDPVAAYLSRTPGERAFCFCANVKHAEHVAETFKAHGVPAATIHGDTPWLMRKARIEAFKAQSNAPLLAAGLLEPVPLVLCNVYCLTEGVDVPEATTCILARGCGHVGMYLQMVGRVLRSAPGKERGVLIDLRGVSHKHKLPEADRVWSLEGKPIDLAESEKDANPIECQQCGGVFSKWSTDAEGKRVCPACRALGPELEIPEVQPRELQAAGAAADEREKEAALLHFAEIAVRKNRAPGWIAYAMEERFGRKPPFGHAQRAFDFVRRGGGVAAE